MKSPRIIQKLCLITSLGIVLLFGFSFLTFWSIVKPPHRKITQTPSQYNLPYTTITLTTQDNIKLSAWFIRNASNNEKRPVLILVHGYPSNKAQMLAFAPSLYQHFDLLLVDLRYFGDSQGSYTTLGIKERFDTRAAVDFLTHQGYARIGIFGFSLGGAAGILAAGGDERIDALASYASFSDLKTLGETTYAKFGVLEKPLVYLLLLWMRLLSGQWPTTASPLSAAKHLSIPVFIIHSRMDAQIPFAHAVRLKEALKKNTKALFYFPREGTHTKLPPDFTVKIEKFFINAL